MKKNMQRKPLPRLSRERDGAPVTLTEPGEPTGLAAEQRLVQQLETQARQMRAEAEVIRMLSEEAMRVYLQAKSILEKRQK